MKEFELNFRTNSSSQFVEWYEGLGIIIQNSLLQNDLPYNGEMISSVLKDVKSCLVTIDSTVPFKSHSVPLQRPNLDFFYNDALL